MTTSARTARVLSAAAVAVGLLLAASAVPSSTDPGPVRRRMEPAVNVGNHCAVLDHDDAVHVRVTGHLPTSAGDTR